MVFKFIICLRIHAGLASWFYVLQVIILVFVFVVNLIMFDIFLWLQHFARPKQQFIVFLG